MNLQRNIRNKGAAVLLLTLSFFMYSCEKDKESQALVKDGNAVVTINMLGSEPTIENNQVAKGAKSAQFASMSASANRAINEVIDSEEIQEQIVQVDEGLSFIATLVPEGATVNKESAISRELIASTVPMGKPMAAAPPVGTERNVLASGVRYRVIAYKADGTIGGSKEYSYGNETTVGGLALDAEETYTFVVYSLNSAGTLPNATGNLASANLTAISGDLMYFQKTMKVVDGDNYLDVILRHKFSQITTTVELSDDTRGNLLSINSTVFNPTRANADFKLSDSVITWGAVKTGGTSVAFPTIGVNGVRSITSTPTLLLSPETTTAKLSIGATTTTGQVANTSRTNNAILEGFKINPGRKYNLNIKVVIPCTENVNVSNNNIFNWSNNGSGADEVRTLTASAADFGFVFDITELDNSFNMTINGTKLLATGPNNNTNNELQFEALPGAPGTARPVNIMFADGSDYVQFVEPAGWNDPRSMWNIIGTAARPALRLVISATGKVSMYGSKTSGAELHPLVLKSGWSFNTITWNKTTANTVRISQSKQNATVMKGSGYGKKIISCP